MATITTKERTQIYSRRGTGQPVVFSHGWPLSADAFEDQMSFLAPAGTGASGTTAAATGVERWTGNDMNTYADDLAAMVESLDLKERSTSATQPGAGKSPATSADTGPPRRQGRADRRGAAADAENAANPGGLPIDAFDQIRAGVQADRSQFFKDLSAPFYGANRPGSKSVAGCADSFWIQGMLAGFPACYDCIKAFSRKPISPKISRRSTCPRSSLSR